MPKKGGKKGKKDKKDKGKKDKKAKEEKSKAVEDTKKDEKKEEELVVEEPCIFNCSQDKVTYRPNSYPGVLAKPKTMAVVGSENGSYDSLSKLLNSGFCVADRVYAMVPWGNYVALRAFNGTNVIYFLFDGCTCNVNRFRYLDLTCGTAGLLYFKELHKLISYIIMSRSRREELRNLKQCVVDEASQEMYGSEHI